MEDSYHQVPDLNDPTKWAELIYKRERIFVESGALFLPLGETRHYRQIENGTVALGAAMTTSFFTDDPVLVSWTYSHVNGNTPLIQVGYTAMKMRNGKWAKTNPLINGISVEQDKDILHIHKYRNVVYVMIKAMKGWTMRKFQRSSPI